MSIQDLESLSTFDLAFNIALGKYDPDQKMQALSIIKERDTNNNLKRGRKPKAAKVIPVQAAPQPVVENKSNVPPAKTKLPLEGSKSEKIYLLLKDNKTVKQVGKELLAQGVKTTPSEIYRVGRQYWPEKFYKP